MNPLTGSVAADWIRRGESIDSVDILDIQFEVAKPPLSARIPSKFIGDMKKSFVTLFLVLGITVNASQELRTFTSADGARSFKGQLVAFDKATETVTVINAKRQRFSFAINVISDDDQEYVNEQADKLPPDANLKISFDELLDRTEFERGAEKTKTKTYDGGYTIHVNSYTSRIISEAEVEYVMIYRKDKVDGDHSDMIAKGSETVVIPPNSSASVDTETVELVNYYKAGKAIGSAGGCSSGGCGSGSVTYTKSERSRDSLIGCVARVTVDGHVVGLSATSPGILEKYESELDSSQ